MPKGALVLRRAQLLAGVVAVLGLAGCGTGGGSASHQRAAPHISGRRRSTRPAAQTPGPAGCTDTWTGNAADNDYTDPANWSSDLVPGMADAACVPPGSYVVVRSAPQQPANSLLIEGMLCLKIPPGALARSIFNGVSPGQELLPELANPSNARCPAGTMLSFQGTSSLNLGRGRSRTPKPAPPTSGPAHPSPKVTVVPVA